MLAAASLLEEDGLDAVSTRAVAARAGVPTPSIFRVFGDKDGLLEAVAEHGFRRYLAVKAELFTADDPVRALREAWDLHIEFGLAHPAYYSLVYGQVRPGRVPRAGRRAADDLRRMITRVAAAGRLRMSVERATEVMHSTGVGTILTLIGHPPEERDLDNAREAREMVIGALTVPAAAAEQEADGHGGHERNDTDDAGADRDGSDAEGTSAADPDAAVASRAMALRAVLGRHGAGSPLSAAERTLLGEWLNRLADGTHVPRRV